jgi:hypothetical protein
MAAETERTNTSSKNLTNEHMKTKYRITRQGCLIGLGCIVSFLILTGIIFLIILRNTDLRQGTITITDIVMTSELDEEGQPVSATTYFSADQPRIYCHVTVSSPKPVNVGIRWYREGELIFVDSALVNGWRAFYIEPLPGEQFQEGNYKVEIYFVEKSVREIEFTIGK